MVGALGRVILLLSLATSTSSCHGANAPTGPRLFVSNEDGGTVTVIDPRQGTVIDTIAVGKRPRGIRLSPDGRSIYVALSGSPKSPPGSDDLMRPPADRSADGIGVIDLHSMKLSRTLQSGQDPESFDVVDGGRALVVSNEETAEASIVEVGSGKVRARVPVGVEPEGVAARPDGAVVYVTSEETDRVHVLEAGTARVIATIATGRRPRAIAFTPDGARAYVTNELGASVTVVDAGRHAVLTTIDIPPEGAQQALPGVAVTGDGKRVVVTTGRARSVAVIDAATDRVERVIHQVGQRPWGVAVAPDGMVYTANGPGDDVTVLDIERGTIVRRIPSPGSPWGIAMRP